MLKMHTHLLRLSFMSVKFLPLMYGAKILKISSCESSGNLIVSVY
jgi:hypothetical protein